MNLFVNVSPYFLSSILRERIQSRSLLNRVALHSALGTFKTKGYILKEKWTKTHPKKQGLTKSMPFRLWWEILLCQTQLIKSSKFYQLMTRLDNKIAPINTCTTHLPQTTPLLPQATILLHRAISLCHQASFATFLLVQATASLIPQATSQCHPH